MFQRWSVSKITRLFKKLIGVDVVDYSNVKISTSLGCVRTQFLNLPLKVKDSPKNFSKGP